jgi:hypothetical protein
MGDRRITERFYDSDIRDKKNSGTIVLGGSGAAASPHLLVLLHRFFGGRACAKKNGGIRLLNRERDDNRQFEEKNYRQPCHD